MSIGAAPAGGALWAEGFSIPRWEPAAEPWGPVSLVGGLGGKAKAALAGKAPDAGTEWLKQFDAMLPGYSLKNELDILTLLKQVSDPWRGGRRCFLAWGQNGDVGQL